MTLSTSHLVDAGNTRLVVLLITINKNPSASSLRRGRASSLMRGSALRRLSEALRLGLGGDTSSRVQRGAGYGPEARLQSSVDWEKSGGPADIRRAQLENFFSEIRALPYPQPDRLVALWEE